MSVKIFVPRDSTALALGADEVAQAIADEAKKRGIDIQLVRNGSRGLFWLEPLVEVELASGRVAYGPVDVNDVASLFGAKFTEGGAHKLALGKTEEIPFLKKQERLTFARIGITDPLAIDDYVAHEGFAGLNKALQMTQEQIVQTVTDSGLRGRGGADRLVCAGECSEHCDAGERVEGGLQRGDGAASDAKRGIGDPEGRLE